MERVRTAVLLHWKRRLELAQVVADILGQNVIDEVRVVSNVRDNKGVYRRWETSYPNHYTVYTQDDDCLVPNIRELVETVDRTGDLVTNISVEHTDRYPQRVMSPDGREAWITLFGWGSAFQPNPSYRRALDIMWAHVKCHPLDLVDLIAGADRMFSILYTGLTGKCPTTIPTRIYNYSSSIDPATALSCEAGYYTRMERVVAVSLKLLDWSVGGHECES